MEIVCFRKISRRHPPTKHLMDSRPSGTRKSDLLFVILLGCGGERPLLEPIIGDALDSRTGCLSLLLSSAAAAWDHLICVFVEKLPEKQLRSENVKVSIPGLL